MYMLGTFDSAVSFKYYRVNCGCHNLLLWYFNLASWHWCIKVLQCIDWLVGWQEGHEAGKKSWCNSFLNL